MDIFKKGFVVFLLISLATSVAAQRIKREESITAEEFEKLNEVGDISEKADFSVEQTLTSEFRLLHCKLNGVETVHKVAPDLRAVSAADGVSSEELSFSVSITPAGEVEQVQLNTPGSQEIAEKFVEPGMHALRQWRFVKADEERRCATLRLEFDLFDCDEPCRRQHAESMYGSSFAADINAASCGQVYRRFTDTNKPEFAAIASQASMGFDDTSFVFNSVVDQMSQFRNCKDYFRKLRMDDPFADGHDALSIVHDEAAWIIRKGVKRYGFRSEQVTEKYTELKDSLAYLVGEL